MQDQGPKLPTSEANHRMAATPVWGKLLYKILQPRSGATFSHADTKSPPKSGRPASQAGGGGNSKSDIDFTQPAIWSAFATIVPMAARGVSPRRKEGPRSSPPPPAIGVPKASPGWKSSTARSLSRSSPPKLRPPRTEQGSTARCRSEPDEKHRKNGAGDVALHSCHETPFTSEKVAIFCGSGFRAAEVEAEASPTTIISWERHLVTAVAFSEGWLPR